MHDWYLPTYLMRACPIISTRTRSPACCALLLLHEPAITRADLLLPRRRPWWRCGRYAVHSPFCPLGYLDSDLTGCCCLAGHDTAVWPCGCVAAGGRYRELALTIRAGDVELLLVAPDTAAKARWVAGLQAVLQ